MGRGAAATIEENLLYGAIEPRRRAPATPRSKEELRQARRHLSDLSDDALLDALSDEEIVSILCDAHASGAFQTRIAVLLRDAGWKARIPAGTRMVRELHPRRIPKPLKRSQTVRIDWVFSSFEDEITGRTRTIPAQVRWAGSGGYWRDAELHPGVALIRPARPEA